MSRAECVLLSLSTRTTFCELNASLAKSKGESVASGAGEYLGVVGVDGLLVRVVAVGVARRVGGVPGGPRAVQRREPRLLLLDAPPDPRRLPPLLLDHRLVTQPKLLVLRRHRRIHIH